MAEAKYGEPWTTYFHGTGDEWIRKANREAIFPISYNQDDRKGYANRIVACVNALSGITNVEALGDFIAASLNLRGGHAEGLLTLPGFWLDALAALYAPQASEAKPL